MEEPHTVNFESLLVQAETMDDSIKENFKAIIIQFKQYYETVFTISLDDYNKRKPALAHFVIKEFNNNLNILINDLIKRSNSANIIKQTRKIFMIISCKIIQNIIEIAKNLLQEGRDLQTHVIFLCNLRMNLENEKMNMLKKKSASIGEYSIFGLINYKTILE